MEKQKNKCFIYHKNGIIQNVDNGSFCEYVEKNKLEFLKNLSNNNSNTILFNGEVFDIIDFWFTDILNESGHKTEYHIKIKEHGD